MEETVPSIPERKRLKLKALRPHSLQPLYYFETTKDEDDRLVEDLRQHGQRDAIVVAPVRKNGHWVFITLDGHRRVWAAGVLGWDALEAIIRWDLADADETAIEDEFLKFNLNRRQLHPLEQARIQLRRLEIEKRRPRGGLRPGDECEARDRVGKVMGKSGRTLSRYVRVLKTPIEVQHAVRDGNLALVDGERVSWLPKQQQAEIAERIHGGEGAKDVVAAYIAPRASRHKRAGDAFTRFAKDLERALADLEDRPNEVYCLTAKEHTPLLDRGRKLLTKLIAQGRKPPGDIAKLLKGFNAQKEQEYFDDVG